MRSGFDRSAPFCFTFRFTFRFLGVVVPMCDRSDHRDSDSNGEETPQPMITHSRYILPIIIITHYYSFVITSPAWCDIPYVLR